jgi:hypothetical protein
VTDDPELRNYIGRKLARLEGERAVAESKRLEAAFDRLVREDLPFVNRATARLLGPAVDPVACAGPGHDDDPACAWTWAEWTRRFQRAR